jgi:hypothetical protein
VARFDRTIPPGGEGQITLEVKTAKYQGKIVKTAKVFSNDPGQPTATIGLTGNVWVPVTIAPAFAQLNGVVGDAVENVVHLEGQKKEPLVVKLVSVSIPDKVGVELKELEKGRRYELKVMNKVEGEATYTGEVKLTSSYSERPEILIKVSGNIRPTIEVRPKALSFGRFPAERLQMVKDKGINMRRPMLVILNKGDNLKINKTELWKSIFSVISIQPLQEGRIIQLQIEVALDKLKKGLNSDHLRIYTNQPDGQVFDVPVDFELL